MAVETTENIKAAPSAPVRDTESELRKKKRRLLDRAAKCVVAVGGFAIIASILAILIFITFEIAPLFRSAEVNDISHFSSADILTQNNAGNIVGLGMHENQEVGFALTDSGRVQFFSLAGGAPRELLIPGELAGEKVTAFWQNLKGDLFVAGTASGSAVVVSADFNMRFFEGTRSYNPEVEVEGKFLLDTLRTPLIDIAFAGNEDGAMILAGLTSDQRVVVYQQKKEQSLFGGGKIDSLRVQLDPIWSGRPLSLAIDGTMKNMYVGTDDGKIYHWLLSPNKPAEFAMTIKASAHQAAITRMTFLIGGRTLIVGDAAGHVSAWFLVRDASIASGWRLTHIRDLEAHEAAITALAPSARGKGFISADATGNMFLQYSTSGRFLADVKNEAAVKFINYAPKANGALSLDINGDMTHWRIDNPHPEAGLKAFFGKVWYEGYEEPEYVWQSTGGTDEFEPKLSLVPLIFGSLKGTLYALVLAVPLAMFGALFTSQFMHPTFRGKIKPAVEIMAALPSVVLGFLGGLWLAPRVESVVPALLMMAIFLPLIILASSFVWRMAPRRIRNRFRAGVEALFLIPVVLAGIWFCLALNGVVESTLFAGDFKVSLLQTFSLPFDQRNALVVGFAMGFAVIPIIYTISEDALSNVPQSLVSGSLALGATRWQTAIRVVLPTAAAGIFSAIMIGLGRAVGETMIVLMATGNTPIMDWNIFNGFRTLSANIAVEVPEAPVGGTLYRVLFLAAMLLFVLTFFVNTLAELVRQRLRKKYQKL